jgi:hypothetical protein
MKWQYDESTGEIVQWRGRPLKRIGPTPCRTVVGCAKGVPEESRALSRANRQAYAHYETCSNVGRFPDDPIVARNARLIASAENEARAALRRQRGAME